MRWIRIAVVVVALGIAAPADAQSTSSVLFAFGGPAGKQLSTTNVPARIAGALIVSFHGDAAAGCAAMGVCAYRGTVVWKPGPAGALAIETYRLHGNVGRNVALAFGVGQTGSVTFSRVRRFDGARQIGSCADEQASGFAQANVQVRGGRAGLSLLQAGGSLLTSRCAGPLDGDLARAGPRAAASLRVLLHGDTRLDLRSARTFSGHGFAGTVSSTVVIGLGRAARSLPSSGFPPGIKTVRTRIVTERLVLRPAGGSLSALIQGTANASLCVLLDSCGLSGTLRLSPAPLPSAGQLFAQGPARLPYRDFLAALGLSRTGSTRGIMVAGSIPLRGGGRLVAHVHQAGPCTDTTSLGSGFVGLVRRGRSLVASYTPDATLRTRCPGPTLSSSGSDFATGSIPLAALARHVLTIPLHAASALEDDGYGIAGLGVVTLTLRRGRLSQSLQNLPTP